MVSTGNHFWDKVILRLGIAVDGALDAPPTWSCDSDLVTLTPTADGFNCDAMADADVGACTITAAAPADNPSTPELENVMESFTASFSHSKATSMTGTFQEIPRT